MKLYLSESPQRKNPYGSTFMGDCLLYSFLEDIHYTRKYNYSILDFAKKIYKTKSVNAIDVHCEKICDYYNKSLKN